MPVPFVTQVLNTSTNYPPANLTSKCSMPYDEDRVPLMILYSMVFVVGVPANFATFLLTMQQVRRANVLGIYLFSLSVCDLMYLCTLPLWALYIYRGHSWVWGSTACKWTGYIFFNNMYISVFLLCCVSVDRYVAVVYSLESRGIRRPKQAWMITMVIVVIVALGHLPVFTMEEGDADSETQQRCFEPGQTTAMVTGFNYARVLIGFLIPFFILVFTNRTILSSIQASNSIKPKQKAKVRRLALAVVVFFLVCFAPYHVILLTRAISFHTVSDKCHFDRGIYTPYSIFLGFSTINSAMNPILYVLSSDNIRKEVRRGLSSVRSWRSSQRPQVSESSGQLREMSAVSRHVSAIQINNCL
ncbi:probable G-protein coupled receptor 132 [Clupea harengus]|uniref:Probable G-protein coupled receptor 132 n=1 Tax=Clupea harengus TaxID=7950 RepID=A0A6P8GHE5_CLUHA|nr:probable G-protein coupled receptor 132 [Clupea harengus]